MNVGNIERYRVGDGWRYRARWSLPSGERQSRSFKLRKDADAWLRHIQADQLRGIVTDPKTSKETLLDYSRRWLAMRQLAPKTIELYRSELNRHILPTLGAMPLGRITTEQVRAWFAKLVTTTSEISAAKCYRLLRAMLTTAEEDRLIPRNPCKIKGAGHERSVERPLLTTEQVLDIAATIEPRYRALVLLAAYGSLRRGELFGLRRRHVNELRGTVTVEGQAQRLTGQGRVIRQPKSDAGLRTVTIPAGVMAELVAHMNTYTASDVEGWVFTAENGGPARESAVRDAWIAAAKASGVPSAHFHDLRHFGGTLAAQAGATTRELQGRLGHATVRAAMIYQHRSDHRDRDLADRMGDALNRGIEDREQRNSKAQTQHEPIAHTAG